MNKNDKIEKIILFLGQDVFINVDNNKELDILLHEEPKFVTVEDINNLLDREMIEYNISERLTNNFKKGIWFDDIKFHFKLTKIGTKEFYKIINKRLKCKL